MSNYNNNFTSLPATPIKPRLDLREIADHPLLRNKRSSSDAQFSGPQPPATTGAGQPQLSADSGCPTPRLATSPSDQTPNSSLDLYSTPIASPLTSQAERNSLTSITISKASDISGSNNNNNISPPRPLFSRNGIASPMPKVVTPNFTISAYTDKPRTTKPQIF